MVRCARTEDDVAECLDHARLVAQLLLDLHPLRLLLPGARDRKMVAAGKAAAVGELIDLFAETVESESRQQSAAQADRFCTHVDAAVGAGDLEPVPSEGLEAAVEGADAVLVPDRRRQRVHNTHVLKATEHPVTKRRRLCVLLSHVAFAVCGRPQRLLVAHGEEAGAGVVPAQIPQAPERVALHTKRRLSTLASKTGLSLDPTGAGARTVPSLRTLMLSEARKASPPENVKAETTRRVGPMDSMASRSGPLRVLCIHLRSQHYVCDHFRLVSAETALTSQRP